MTSMPSRLVHRAFVVAARRWPAADRDELIREWLAESHALGHEPGVPAPVRTWRQIRFAASLVCARRSGIGPVGAIPVDRVERTALHVVALFLAPLAAAVLAILANGPLWMASSTGDDLPAVLTLLNRTGHVVAGIGCGVLLADRLRHRRGAPASRSWCLAATIPVLAGLVVAESAVRHLAGSVTDSAFTVAVTGPAGAVVGPAVVAGTLIPLTIVVATIARRAPRWALAAAVPATAAVTLAASVITASLVAGLDGARTPLPIPPGILLGAVALSLAYTVRAVRPRPPAPPRPRPATAPRLLVATTAVIGGGLLVAYLFTPYGWWATLPTPVVTVATLATNAFCFAVARWAAGRIPASRPDPIWPEVVAGQPTILVDRGAGAARQAAVPAGQPESVPAGQPGSVPPRRSWREILAWGGAAGAAIGWAVTLAYLTPNIGLQTPWPHTDAVPAGWAEWDTSTGRVWMQDLQMYAICCVAVCLAAAAAYRRASLLPALASPVVLYTATVGVIQSGWHTQSALPWLAAGALLLTIAAWWATDRLAPTRRRSPERDRLLVARLAVLAAFLVPGLYVYGVFLSDGPPVPPVALAVTVGLSTVLAVVAGAAVTASSARTSIRTLPETTAAAWSLAVGAGAAVFGTAVLSGAVMSSPVTYPLAAVAPALAVPAAALTIATIRAPRTRRTPGVGRTTEAGRVSRPAGAGRYRLGVVRRVGSGIGLGVVLLAGGYVALVCGMILAFGFGQLLPWLEYQQSYDPIGYLPGGVALGLLLAFLTPYLVEPWGTYPGRSVVPVPPSAVAESPVS
ncbi:hypothetical protein O7632_14540 [Solwaraspora sp. WMMD406]|uniref:hypothetical protein n=1 Tax=Solwaraspora sp. WMMD406 TaxID=3016095 RepID=UPI002416A07E|nr:hypothetical protein [Solwaraspora sp. WMMD406]MDG4765303.1 hypothetical protein [Solwaraspora sp. WMMD406]